MAERKLVLTRAEESLLDRLDDERNAIEKFMRHVRAAQRRRDLLIVKLRGAGLPARALIQAMPFVTEGNLLRELENCLDPGENADSTTEDGHA